MSLAGDLGSARPTRRRPLLSIAIPTYNRAAFLNTCLSHILSQYGGHEEDLELIVADNHCTDNTKSVIESFRWRNLPIRYVKQKENVGADRNFADCFALASGKYVLILGDDDILLEGAIETILTVLKNGDYGNVYLNSYGFREDHLQERPAARPPEVLKYHDAAEYFGKVNFWITFSSGNIVNKSLIASEIDPMRFVGTNMVQLNWILSAILKAKTNAYLEEYIVAFKSANTGGYRLCEVFGVNINKVFSTFVRQGVPKRYFDIINRLLLTRFFPMMLMSRRMSYSGFSFGEEDCFAVLCPVFRRYPEFWLFVVPLIILPLPVAAFWRKVMDKSRRALKL